MNMFGWSLPAGCGTLPGEEDVYIHPLSEELLGKLEDAGIPENQCNVLIEALDKAIDNIYLALEEAASPPWYHDPRHSELGPCAGDDSSCTLHPTGQP